MRRRFRAAASPPVRELGARMPELPTHSREAIEQELAALDFLETQIEAAR